MSKPKTILIKQDFVLENYDTTVTLKQYGDGSILLMQANAVDPDRLASIAFDSVQVKKLLKELL